MTTGNFCRGCVISVSWLAMALLAGCSESSAPAKSGATQAGVVRPATDPALLEKGKVLYGKNCASCHGVRAQGAHNWQQPGADGKYPPPPLNGSAHSWHHPYAQLKQTIQEGTLRLGGSMPPWKGKLADADIEAVILHFQSLWPDEIYQAWIDIDRRARTAAAK